jgi:predicted nucleic acid-binding protein
VKIYLDNCCYNRPFDSQEQPSIQIETSAKLYIQALVKYSAVSLVASSVLLAEVNKNPSEGSREHIRDFILKNAAYYIDSARLSAERSMFEDITRTGVKPYDAAHVACAIIADCDYFITTDKRLLKYSNEKILLKNPAEFIEIWEENNNV